MNSSQPLLTITDPTPPLPAATVTCTHIHTTPTTHVYTTNKNIKTQLKNINFLKEAEQGLGIYLSGRVLAEQAQARPWVLSSALGKKKKRAKTSSKNSCTTK